MPASRANFADLREKLWQALGPRPLVRPATGLALALTVLTYPRWTLPVAQWPADVLGVVPDAMGFSLGGFAILLAFTQGKIMHSLVVPEDDGPSPYLKVAAWFGVLVLLQVLALLVAIVAQSWAPRLALAESGDQWLWRDVLGCAVGFLGYLVFLLSLCLSGSVLYSLFDLARAVSAANKRDALTELCRNTDRQVSTLEKLQLPEATRVRQQLEEIKRAFLTKPLGKKALFEQLSVLELSIDEAAQREGKRRRDHPPQGTAVGHGPPAGA